MTTEVQEDNANPYNQKNHGMKVLRKVLKMQQECILTNLKQKQNNLNKK